MVVSPKASALTEVLNRVQAHSVNIVALMEGGKGEVLRLTLPETFTGNPDQGSGHALSMPSSG